jgi:TolB-like protein/Flp pilus assembly protein TadD
MKRCPECKRDYYDETLLYCLDDGNVLLEGPASADEPPTAILPDAGARATGFRPEEPQTARLHETARAAEAQTRAQIHTTEQTAVLPSTSAGRSGARSGFDKRLLLVPLVFAAIVLGGFLGYRYVISGSDQIKSIAVLPFENRSGSTDTDYLSDGLTDSLIFRFSQLPNIKVSPTSSVMRYKGASGDIADIAKDLNVDGVLSGRLTQLGDNLSISVQLIDARTGKIVWAEQYDRKLTDLLSTQREIAATLTQKMQLRLAGDERGIVKKYTSSNEAYQLYLKGRFHWAKRKKDDMLIAVDSFKKAIELDPNFALAYVGIAEAYNSMGKNPDIPPREAIPLAKSAAARAIELDPTLAEAHSAMADAMAIGDWDWDGSEREFMKALEMDPNISYIHLAYSGSYLTAQRRTDEAVSETAQALELEPMSLINNALHVTSLVNAGRNEEALVQARKAYELDHDFPLSRHWLGVALSAAGKYDEAIALGNEVPPGSPIRPIGLFISGLAQAKAGRRAQAEQIIEQMKETAKTVYVRPYYIAAIYAVLGDSDNAFAELERSFAERDCYLPRMNLYPIFQPLRDDARFRDLLRRMNLPG